MKRKQLPKSPFLLIAVFSLSSFVFVNLHASFSNIGVCDKAKQEQSKLEECENGKSREIPLPDVTALGRILALAQKLLEVAG